MVKDELHIIQANDSMLQKATFSLLLILLVTLVENSWQDASPSLPERVDSALENLCARKTFKPVYVQKCVQPPDELRQIRVKCRESSGLPEGKNNTNTGVSQVCQMLGRWKMQLDKNSTSRVRREAAHGQVQFNESEQAQVKDADVPKGAGRKIGAKARKSKSNPKLQAMRKCVREGQKDPAIKKIMKDHRATLRSTQGRERILTCIETAINE